MATVINLRGRNPRVIHLGEVYCGRAINRGGWNLPASKWANPFKVGQDCQTIDECLLMYMTHIMMTPGLYQSLPELRGKTLACWCKPNPCHCDVLVHILSHN